MAAAGVIAGGRLQHQEEALRAAQAVAALDQLDHGLGAQLGGARQDAVLARHHLGEVAAVGGGFQALRHLARAACARGLVAVVVRQGMRWRVALAEVVQQAGPAHRERLARGGGVVDHHQHVLAGVDLGVVLLGLGHAEQAVEFGQQACECAAGAQHADQARGARLHEPACELLPDAFGDQVVDLARRDHGAHQRERLGRQLEVGEAGREARHAQDA